MTENVLISLLFALDKIMKLLWVTGRLLVTRVSLIYLVDEFFIFSLLVLLLKEMRTRGESKISSCCFCVWCKSRELDG